MVSAGFVALAARSKVQIDGVADTDCHFCGLRNYFQDNHVRPVVRKLPNPAPTLYFSTARVFYAESLADEDK